VLLGCPKNQVDAEHILGTLVEAGYRITDDAGSADVVVIATCAFLQSAVRESESVITRTLALKRHRPELKVVVAGCLVQRLGQELPRRFPGVDLWAGLNELQDIPRMLRMRAQFFSGTRPCHLPDARTPRLLSTPKHFAWLRIADGCENRCSYCVIPDIRGRFRSRPMPDIIAEARALARAGVRELILVAQDTTLYGRDIYSRPALAHLLRRLNDIDGLRWLRLMYAHPAHLTEDVIDELASNPKLCRYIDLPIQHVSGHLLKKMNRPYGREDIELLLTSLRAIPDLHIRTTIIVGFPGETEADFRELLDFVSVARIDRLSCYAYSPEPGTPAGQLRPQVSPHVKARRVKELMHLQARISRANLRRLVGQRIAVLVDSPGIGRTEWDAPEIDGIVKLTRGPAQPGRFVKALVTSSSTHDLTAHIQPKRCAGKTR
jgi:ribosomal protein S12 methylthiotransferase